MAHHRRKRPRKQSKSCGLCAPHKRAGNSRKHDSSLPGRARMAPRVEDWEEEA
jgi:hypothetical protein